MKKTIGIYIGSQAHGFWSSIAIILSKDFHVVIITLKESEPLIKKLIAGYEDFISFHFIRHLWIYDKIILSESVIDDALKNEEKYGVKFSYLMSMNRGIGKGYVTNVHTTPNLKSAYLPYEHKIQLVNDAIGVWEAVIKKNKPIAILSTLPKPEMATVSRYYNVLTPGINYVKFGDRMFWMDNEYFQSYRLIDSINYYVDKAKNENRFTDFNYEYIQSSKFTQRKYHTKRRLMPFIGRLYSVVFNSLKRHLSILYRRSKGLNVTKTLYPIFGWLPATIMFELNKNIYLKNGIQVNHVKGVKFIYIPMAFEPEVAVMQFSPEFTNVMELITMLSKAVPVDWKLIVKESPAGFGHRNMGFHKKLMKIPNVELAHPDAHTWDWIKASEVVSVITGTAAFESVYFKKPIISFGNNQLVNSLPTVWYVNNYFSVCKAVEEIVDLENNDKAFNVSREALYRATMDNSFSMPGYIQAYKGKTHNMELAKIAIDNLHQSYPELLN